MRNSDLLAKALDEYNSGRLAEAAATCEKGLRRTPNQPALHKVRGDVLQLQGHHDEAIAAYDRALRFDKSFQPAWYAAGCAWLGKDNFATALTCFERAVALNPNDAASHHNLGTAQSKLGLVDEALRHFRSALSLRDGFLPRTAIATLIPGSPAADQEAVLAARRDWADTHLPPPPSRRRIPATHSPLRVGYLSSFFESRNWMKPVWGLINNHDRAAVEVHLFADCAQEQCIDCYQPHPTDCFHDISALSNRAAAERIEQSGVDLLVDLNGYSRVTRLAVVAQRPAPLVVAWFNMYASSGMACYDRLIGDEQVIGPEEERFYTERIARVPGCYLTFDVRYPVPEVSSPPAVQLGHFTFGCLASQYKITPQVVEVWSRILLGVPSARLFLKNSALGLPANREHLTARFAQHGIAAERLELEGPSAHLEFLAAYGRVDLALDTFPYNGGTTTSEAIWQGVPVLTFAGDRWASRQSASILRAGGLREFVADGVDHYVERAIGLASNPETPAALTGLRHSMRDRLSHSPLCDTPGFARAMEALYRRFIEESLHSDHA
jgi:predicted O-linked N-acetylglucosamine transferase (SPINDLY family)